MTDDLTIPLEPEPLSARMRAWGKVLADLGQPTDAIFLAEWADEAAALEARASDPWENCRDVVFQDEEDDDVCFMATKHSTDQSKWRRMIAAAPDMLALLDRCRTKLYNAAIIAGTIEPYATTSVSEIDELLAKIEWKEPAP